MGLQLQIAAGSKLLNQLHMKDPKIVTGNMYSKSFGQAGSPYCVPYL
jgi:hypothetical protein